MDKTGLECRLTSRSENNSDFIVFHGYIDAPSDLWNLEDYKVTSVIAGSVWLHKIKD